MAIGTKILIDRIGRSGPVKKYRVTPEQLERNEREQMVQRERDERARNQVRHPPNHVPTQPHVSNPIQLPNRDDRR